MSPHSIYSDTNVFFLSNARTKLTLICFRMMKQLPWKVISDKKRFNYYTTGALQGSGIYF